MPEMIARCGFKCHDCVAFVGRNKTPEDQAEAARAWRKYFDLAVPAADIRCNGCLAKDRGSYRFPERSCYFSACVLKRGLDNCGACSEYPCGRLEARMKSCDKVCEKFRNRITRAEFRKCIAPYDLKTTLDRIRGRKR